MLELSLFSGAFLETQSVQDVLKCNEITKKFGLVLTEGQARSLVETRNFSLRENGRIEFGGGVIDQIIFEFCDSSFLSMDNYEESLHELLEIFYYYKNESMDVLSDEELIRHMKNAFEGACKGSMDLLSNREMAHIARNIRFGYTAEYSEEEVLEDEWEDEDGCY